MTASSGTLRIVTPARATTVVLALFLAMLGALTVAAPASAATTFSNTTSISVQGAVFDCPDTCHSVPQASTPYPSAISVSGLSGTVSDLNVSLDNVSSTYADGLDVLLVGPGGESFVLVSDAGNNDTPAMNNVTATFDDSGAAKLPASGASRWAPDNSTVTAKPSNYSDSGAESWPAPAPSGPYGNADGNATLGSVFDGINPNGTWKLYAVDDTFGDPTSTIAGGWSLDISTVSAAATTTTLQSSPNPSSTGQSVTFTAHVTAAGPDVTAGTVSFREGATTLASNVALDAGGLATFSTSALSEGAHTVTATYNGTASFAQSSGSTSQVVDTATSHPSADTWCNTGDIAVPASGTTTGPGYPYASHLSVPDAAGTIDGLSVQLTGLTHTAVSDVDVLLVGPGGQRLVLMSDVGDPAGVSGVDTTFSDASPAALPASGAWTSGSYRPTDVGSGDSFPAPAPAGPYAEPAPAGSDTLAGTFGGTDPSGTWSLFVVDDALGDTGSLSGWCVSLSYAPVATDDSYATAQNTTLDVAAPGVLGNDTSTTTRTAVAQTAAATTQGGLVTLDTDGSFTYTPPTDFTGDDTFDYQVSNGTSTDTGTVTIHVSHAPSATGSTLTREQGSPATSSTVATVSDAETAANALDVQLGTVPSGISVTDLANDHGTVTATVGAACGATTGDHTVPFTVTDGDGNTTDGSFTVTVTANTAPVLSYDDLAVNQGSSGTHGPATGLSDNGDATYTSFTVPAGLSGVSGDLSDGVVSYTDVAPAGAYTVTTRATDNCGTTRDASFTLTVNGKPTVDAGPDQTIDLPGTATLAGSVTDDGRAPGDATPTPTWSKDSGPGSVTFTDETDPTTTASFGAPGVYVLKLTGDDGQLTAGDTVQVTVRQAPTLHVPDDFTVTESPEGSGTASVPFTVTADGYPAPDVVCKIGASTVTSPVTLAIGAHLLDCTATNTAGTDSESFTITVAPANQAPTADAGGPYAVDEGGTLHLDAGGSTDPDSDALTYTWDVDGDGTFGDATGKTPDLTWSGLEALGIDDGPSSYGVKVQVSDGHGHTDTSPAATLSVANAAPVASGPTAGDASKDTPFDLGDSATDPSGPDQAAGLTWHVDWGDGSTSSTLGHTFTHVGTYEVHASATDRDGATSNVVTTTVTVGGAEVPVPRGTLRIGGHGGDDVIHVWRGRRGLNVDVNGTRTRYTGVQRMVVDGAGGDDTVTLGAHLWFPHLVYGGNGDDTLVDSSRLGVLVGGSGEDHLVGGSNRNVLLGGAGADVLEGAPGSDALVADQTAYDVPTTDSQDALWAIGAEWRRGASYATRVAHLLGTRAGGLNGSHLLAPGSTVADDGAADTLTGSRGQDWFVLNSAGSAPLDTSDARSGEVSTDS